MCAVSHDPTSFEPTTRSEGACRERELFIDNPLVRIHFIIVMIRWTGLAPWEFESSFPGAHLVRPHHPERRCLHQLRGYCNVKQITSKSL